MAFSWEDARRCPAAQVSREYEARSIGDSIITDQQRDGCGAIPRFPEAAISRKAWCRFSVRSEE